MFGIEYFLAAMKIFTNIGFAIVTAIPLWISWNCVTTAGYIPKLPEVYLNLPYWHVVAIILVCRFVGELVKFLCPTFVKISQSNDNSLE